jgi:hypothetical protein
MLNPQQLTPSRIQLHYAIQFIAATGMALGTSQADGSQVTLDWSADVQGFIGRKVSGIHPFYVALEPIALKSWILDDQQRAIAALSLPGKTMAEALDWHRAELAKLGAEVSQMALLTYPDDFPDYSLAHGAAFENGDAAARKAVAAYFAHTRPLLQTLVASRAGASPLHIWPHHFDMATLIPLSESGEDAPTIGVGLSPGDSGYAQPYWYVTPWPYPDPAALPRLPIGTWHTQGWVGAILRGSEVGDPADPTVQQTLKTFLDEAVQASYAVLASSPALENPDLP